MTTKRALIYARRSLSSDSRQLRSLKTQETVCRDWASRHGYQVVDVITESMSGRVLERPGLSSALERAAAEDLVVIVYRVDRISRRLASFSMLEEIGLERLRVCQFGSDCAPSMTMISMCLILAQSESEALSARVKATYKVMKEKGEAQNWGMCDPAKRALALKKAKRVQKERASETNRKIQIICSGLQVRGFTSLSKKAAELNRLGIKTRRGKAFTKHSLNRVLNYPVA